MDAPQPNNNQPQMGPPQGAPMGQPMGQPNGAPMGPPHGAPMGAHGPSPMISPMDMAPVALVYYDEVTGDVRMFNKKAVDLYREITGREDFPKNLYKNELIGASTQERMMQCEEFEIYAYYDAKSNIFLPISSYQQVVHVNTILVINFVTQAPNGQLTSGLALRKITKLLYDWMKSELENTKLKFLTELYGLTELVYHPSDMTLDMRGGRDNYNIKGASIDQIINILHPDDKSYFLKQFYSLTPDNPEKMHITVRVHSFKLKSYRYFKLHMFPQFDGTGNLSSFVGFCVDVTDEEMALRQKMAEVSTLMEAKKETDNNLVGALANISHDLRSPLGVILGFSDLIAVTKNPTKRAEYNKIIQDTGNHMLSMVNNILDLNKLESGTFKFNISTFDVEKLLDEIFKGHQLQFESKGLELKFIPLNKEVMITSDEGRLMEILENYISNALKHTHEGSVTLCYEELEDGGIRVHVVDTGVGISAENCKKVFERFEMLNTKEKGHGLGLNICMSLAKAMGGNVGVYSDIGEGSDFWVELPKTYKEQTPEDAHEAPHETSPLDAPEPEN